MAEQAGIGGAEQAGIGGAEQAGIGGAEQAGIGGAEQAGIGGPRVLVAGATGFAGALAAYLLWRHPRFELAGVTGRSDVGRRLDQLYPRYRVPFEIEELDLAAIEGPRRGAALGGAGASVGGAGASVGGAGASVGGAGASVGSAGASVGGGGSEVRGGGLEARGAGLDAAIVAYPHGASASTVVSLGERGLRVVDLSADFRLSALSDYERSYGEHLYPELLGDVAYGLPELNRAQIAGAAIVANPGCYPTAALLALAPLARAGLIADVVIDAKQGTSGAGRTPTELTHLSMIAENIIPYQVASHRHTPEIEEQLALLGFSAPVQLQTQLIPIDQGELACCYVTPTRAVEHGELRALLAEAYEGEPFIELVDDPPGVREVRETNFARLFAASDRHTGKLLVFAAIDNLWKGTSSQAIQNLNLMFGFDETEGLL